jgi:DNA-directed RNA polymerase subunit alpha
LAWPRPPSRVVLREKLTDTYGEFTSKPFERGFGHTVGNSLRRILLSSLEGSAVTRIKIRGVDHEFSSIPGMVEDITDLVLNIKGWSSRITPSRADDPDRARSSRGDHRADILHDESIEIINPDHILCT